VREFRARQGRPRTSICCWRERESKRQTRSRVHHEDCTLSRTPSKQGLAGWSMEVSVVVVMAQMRASNAVGRVFESLISSRALIGGSRGGPGAVGPISRRCCSSRRAASAGPPCRSPPSPPVPPPDWMHVPVTHRQDPSLLSGSLFLYAPKISSWFPCIIGLQQELRSPTTHPSSGACHGLPRPAADCSHVGCERANIRSRASPSRPSLFSPSPASTLIRKSYS
jgi:hypothetical protein